LTTQLTGGWLAPVPGTDEAGALTYNHMVVGGLKDDGVDELFRALADPTRRDILRRCAGGEPSVSGLARAYPISLTAVQKHVAVLERAGLVTKERRGREQLVRTDTGAFGHAREALDQLEATWQGRVERMTELLDEAIGPEPENPEARGAR
jgi:DNA-binding transcriptional ArsR family regulator